MKTAGRPIPVDKPYMRNLAEDLYDEIVNKLNKSEPSMETAFGQESRSKYKIRYTEVDDPEPKSIKLSIYVDDRKEDGRTLWRTHPETRIPSHTIP